MQAVENVERKLAAVEQAIGQVQDAGMVQDQLRHDCVVCGEKVAAVTARVDFVEKSVSQFMEDYTRWEAEVHADQNQLRCDYEACIHKALRDTSDQHSRCEHIIKKIEFERHSKF